jgi:hypothetical protein
VKIDLTNKERDMLVTLLTKEINEFSWADGEEEKAGKYLLALQAIRAKVEAE